MMNEPGLNNWENTSVADRKKFAHYLKRADKNKILKRLPDYHQKAFEKIDCLSCANCCRNYSPRFKTPDIKRIARVLKMKESNFIATYLKLDEDGDYVTQQSPCPFLGEGNFCAIYEERPSDCHRFPYTDEDVFFKRPSITLKNATFCPAVHFVLQKLVQ